MPPVINEDKCKRCNKCVDTCSEDVFYGSQKGEFPVVTYPEVCWYCNCCVNECPVEGAIKLQLPLSLSVCYK